MPFLMHCILYWGEINGVSAKCLESLAGQNDFLLLSVNCSFIKSKKSVKYTKNSCIFCANAYNKQLAD